MAGIDETVWVPEARAEAFAARIAAMNDRARRLGARARVELAEVGRAPHPTSVTRRVFREGAFHVETVTEPRPCVAYRMACPEPAIALPGWSWAGWIAVRKARKDSATGAVDAPAFHADPARPIPPGTLARAFDASGRMLCEHCGTFRNRRMGFVVRDADGGDRIVGSSCLLDHVGHDPKAVQRAFASLSFLRDEIARERSVDDFCAQVYDWEAHARAEREAAAARDAVRLPARRIVACAIRAMLARGFYARDTEAETRRLIDEGYEPSPLLLARADAVLAWRDAAEPDRPLAGDAVVALGDYLAIDPGFRVVDRYRASGRAPLGRAYEGAAEAEVTCLRLEDASREVDTAYGARPIEAWRYVFKDDEGSRLVWETASDGLGGAFAPGARLRIRFRAKRSWIDGLRLTTRVSNVRAA